MAAATFRTSFIDSARPANRAATSTGIAEDAAQDTDASGPARGIAVALMIGGAFWLSIGAAVVFFA